MKVVPHLDRSDLVHFTTRTVEKNLTKGMLLVSMVLFLFLGNIRGALIIAITIPFSLMFAAICLDLGKIPANLLSLGALDFGMVVDGSVVMIENIIRHLGREENERLSMRDRIRAAAHEVQRPVFYAKAMVITAFLPIFTLQRVEGRLFRPMAWTVAFALLGALVFSILIATGARQLRVSQGRQGVAQPGHRMDYRPIPPWRDWAVHHRSVIVGVVGRWHRNDRAVSC